MKLPGVFSRKNRILLKELVKTDFKLRYEGSVLGMLWSVVKPLFLFAIMYVVFVKFLRFGAGIPHFAVSLLFATVIWSFFTEATSQGMQSIVGRGDILRKINLPKSIIVVSATVSALINLLINLVVVLVFAIINGVDFSWTVILVVPLLLELYLFSLCVALLLSALFVKFRDISHIWEIFLQGAFYATPIIYPLSMVTAFSPFIAQLAFINPMAQIIQDARLCLTNVPTETIWTFVTNPWIKIAPFVIMAVIAVAGILYFRKQSRYFTELV
jgi:ABC-2 type transport system permease protein